MKNRIEYYGIGIIALVLIGSGLIINYQAYAVGCYDKFIFNWFSLNDVLLCLDNSSGSGVTSINAGTGISVNQTTGNVLVNNTGVISGNCSAGIICSGVNPLAISPRWQLLCENTLGSNNAQISCDNFTATENIIFTVNYGVATSNVHLGIRFNADSATNYAYRGSFNGGADTNTADDNECQPFASNNQIISSRNYFSGEVMNYLSSGRKLMIGWGATDGNSGSGAPNRTDTACTWDNTSNQVTSITALNVNAGGGVFTTGTTISVWGYS